jgi:hypothetical protein
LALSAGTAQRELAFVHTATADYRTVSVKELLGAGSDTGREAAFRVAKTTSSGADTWGVGDLIRVRPARLAVCESARPLGCSEFTYRTTNDHRLAEFRDPRWDGSTGNSSDYRHEIEWAGSPLGPQRIDDNSRAGTARLFVVTYDDTRVGSLTGRRVIWQDAAAQSASAAEILDLSPEGNVLTRYIRKGCNGSCTFNTSGTYPGNPSANEIAESSTFDGLAGLSSTTTYRCPGVATGPAGCPGTTAQRTMTRQGRNAAAKVDSLIDPLAAGNTAWTQTSQEFFSSLRDSGGLNPDLYRTEYAYDAANRLVQTDHLYFSRTPRYAATVLGPAEPEVYRRLGASGATDLTSPDRDGTVSGAQSGASGALRQDPDTAYTFDGNDRITNDQVSVNSGTYAIEAWFKTTQSGQTSKGIAGRWLSNAGARLYLGSSGNLAFQHADTILKSGLEPVVGRWYHLVASKTPAYISFYVDGQLVDRAKVSTAPGTGSTEFEVGSHSNGSGMVKGAIDEVAVYPDGLDPATVMAHYLLGHAVARKSGTTT